MESVPAKVTHLGGINAVETLLQVGEFIAQGNVVDAELLDLALVGRALDIEEPSAIALDVERTLGLRDFVLRGELEFQCHRVALAEERATLFGAPASSTMFLVGWTQAGGDTQTLAQANTLHTRGFAGICRRIFEKKFDGLRVSYRESMPRNCATKAWNVEASFLMHCVRAHLI